MGPNWEKANHVAVGRIASCQHGGVAGHVHRHFRILFVDNRFLGGGRGVSSPYSSLGMKMALKNCTGMDSFPIHRLV